MHQNLPLFQAWNDFGMSLTGQKWVSQRFLRPYGILLDCSTKITWLRTSRRDRSKPPTYGKTPSFWFSLLNLHHSRSHGKLLKFCLCHLNYTFYLVKLWLERFHCLVHTHFTPYPAPTLAALPHCLYLFPYRKDWKSNGWRQETNIFF